MRRLAWGTGGLAVALAFSLLAACAEEDGVRTPSNNPKATASTGNRDLQGDSGSTGTNPTPSPSPSSAKASPTPSPFTNASPSPDPEASPYAVSVAVSPRSPELYLPGDGGSGQLLNYPTSTRFSAVVLWSTSATTSAVAWTSSNPGALSIDPTTGLALSAGTAPGTVTVTATSPDGKASASLDVTLKAVGDVAVSVQ